ncbi:hypothetical protein KKE06_00060 [Candidatus Micrarchaeota archaeon]|nr:hypothetical protein [Candidatus Micrarchaeota archaeon]MBU1930478.1 hypothetical protein [Candidatus Micrarchaeota archaeon]
MVSRAHLLVSFLSLISAWIVGFAFAKIFDWQFPLLVFDMSTFLGLFWMGLVMLVFSMMFFGRLGFLIFLMLGAIQAGDTSSSLLLLSFLQALVLSWFGMIGVLIGEQLFADLNNRKEFDLLNKTTIYFFVIGVILAVIVSLLSEILISIGERLVDFMSKVRSGELSLENFFELFTPEDTNNIPPPDQMQNPFEQ